MRFHITKILFLHTLGSLYEIGTGQSYTQRVLIPKLLGKPRKPSEAEANLLNEQAARSI
jgi:hypothetical protein